MVLVGSKALWSYLPLNRIAHDWDIWMSEVEYRLFWLNYNLYLVKETPHSRVFDVRGDIVEVKVENQFDLTDHIIWYDCAHRAQYGQNTIETPFGKCYVPTIQQIYDMKKATALCLDNWKHKYDLELIEEYYKRINKNSMLFQQRLEETKKRVEKSKKEKFEFFHRNAVDDQKVATIPEYIEHDRLHEMIMPLICSGASLPTYLRITDGEVAVDIEKFRKLNYYQKLCLMVEESLVLALERWFIPQMVENGINAKLIKMFYNNNEASPTYKLLTHVNIKGLIGEHPEIVEFGRRNINDIEKLWVKFKYNIEENGGFPKWFYNELFDLRSKYKKGEKVGLHHNRYKSN